MLLTAQQKMKISRDIFMEFTEDLKETAPFTDNRVSLMRRLRRTEEGQKKKLIAKLWRALLQK